MPLIWGQNSKFSWQNPVQLDLKSECIVPDIRNAQQQKEMVEGNIIGIPDCKEMIPKASDKDSNKMVQNASDRGR